MAEPLQIQIGLNTNQSITINITGWTLDSDINDCWIICDVSASLNDFSADNQSTLAAEIQALLFRLKDLTCLVNALETLHTTLVGTAELTLHSFSVQLVGNGLGSIQVIGYVRDEQRNTLNFDFDIDQTFLPSIIQQTKAILASVPTNNKISETGA